MATPYRKFNSNVRVASLNTTDITSITAATTLTRSEHSGRTLVFDAAAGFTATLPAATGSGDKYRIIIGTSVSSNDYIINVVGDDIFVGHALLAQDAADTAVMFTAAATSDQINLDGSTQGGLVGMVIELEDIKANTWFVKIEGTATGTEATPFVDGAIS